MLMKSSCCSEVETNMSSPVWAAFLIKKVTHTKGFNAVLITVSRLVSCLSYHQVCIKDRLQSS